MTKIAQYMNGNCNVTLLSDGTKIREYEKVAKPEYPESIDVKITNYCDLACSFCHEKSSKKGIHCNFDKYIDVFKQFPRGVELALGGGNPLSHPLLTTFLQSMKERGIICNMTVNSSHIQVYENKIKYLLSEKLVYGLGISYNYSSRKFIKNVKNDNTVIHLIVGIHTTEDLSWICDNFKNVKVLLLGYKEIGRGKKLYEKINRRIEAVKYEWYRKLPKFFNKKGLILSLDNLAIKQLNIKRFFSEKKWNEFYMGNDGEFTMYMDLVKGKYAKSSTSNIRIKLSNDIKKMFKRIDNL